MKSKIIIGIGATIGIVLAIIFISTISPAVSPKNTIDTRSADNIDTDMNDSTAHPKILITDGVKHTIPLEQIRGGGPPKDGIPSIDQPIFAKDVDLISDTDIVIGIATDTDVKAYPLFILVWHEIVNDIIDDVPIAVTYCPLCYTSQVFMRDIDGETTEFGTTGKLYNSNLLMYDRLTDSYWSQALGTAVKGELAGKSLDIMPFDLMRWRDWKSIHPDTLVLTTDTGHVRAYGTDPYGNYYTDPNIMFPVSHRDDTLHPKEVIAGLYLDDTYKAYRQNDIETHTLINDSVGDVPILLLSLFDENYRIFDRRALDMTLEFEVVDGSIIDTQTKSVWNYDGISISGELEGNKLERLASSPGFWFEWVAFHPETLLYEDIQ